MTHAYRQSFFFTAAMALGLTVSSCGLSPRLASAPVMPTSTYGSAYSVKSDVEQAFRTEVAKHGVKLTDAQFAQIKAERGIMPNGQFAPRPAENLTAEQNLEVHFLKHHTEFGIKTSAEYLKAAVAHAGGKNGPINYYFDCTSFDKGYQTHVVRWNAKTREFGAVRADGAVTTYYKNNKVEAKRFVPVPDFTQ